MKASCKSCGSEVLFQCSISVFAICTFCRSILVRHDLNLENLGKTAELPPDMSPIQIGTQGHFAGQAFEVFGKLRMNWEDGFWNEWFCQFKNGREGWLAEAQGRYMMSFRELNVAALPQDKELTVGASYALTQDKIFILDDIKETTCGGSEGELPFLAMPGRKSLSVDFTESEATSPGFANIEFSETDGVRFFVGKYLEFDDLKFSHLKKLEGW